MKENPETIGFGVLKSFWDQRFENWGVRFAALRPYFIDLQGMAAR